MLSILIATYQRNCTELVAQLVRQADAMKNDVDGFEYELIVADDGSDDAHFLHLQNALCQHACCRLLRMEKNVGRARIRNLLAREAKYGWLLFMDDDAEVAREDFLQHYWQCRDRADVVCGGLMTPRVRKEAQKACALRYKYDRTAQKRNAALGDRRGDYLHFTTFNFLASSRVFETVEFDERFVGYGYEDTLFGLALQEAGLSLLYIDNPLIHAGVDTNVEFLDKTHRALQTLSRLNDERLQQVGAMKWWKRLHKLHLDKFVARRKGIKKILTRNLLSQNPSLTLFQAYKLISFCELQNGTLSAGG